MPPHAKRCAQGVLDYFDDLDSPEDAILLFNVVRRDAALPADNAIEPFLAAIEHLQRVGDVAVRAGGADERPAGERLADLRSLLAKLEFNALEDWWRLSDGAATRPAIEISLSDHARERMTAERLGLASKRRKREASNG